MLDNKEIEVKFENIDTDALKKRLSELSAVDHGEKLLTEKIFYDTDNTWQYQNKFVRIRGNGEVNYLTFKHFHDEQVSKRDIHDVTDVEFPIPDVDKATAFLECIGLVCFRIQEKKRHTFSYKGGLVDFDTWPKVPTYIEIEGSSEENVKEITADLSLDWECAIFQSAGTIIEKHLGKDWKNLRYWTFDRQE
jgi:adenylate cyclase, class 2